jgi:hypothetical protein
MKRNAAQCDRHSDPLAFETPIMHDKDNEGRRSHDESWYA